MSELDIKQLRYFFSVVDAGSFSRAAVVLGVTQPVLSRQIRLLEESVGVELLFRNGRGVELTEAGMLLVRDGKPILDQVNSVRAEISDLQEAPKGNFAIGIPPTVSSVLTVPLVRAIENELPLVSLKIVDALSGYILEWLSTGRLDIAVLYDAPIMTTLNVDELIREELVLVGTPKRCDAPQGDTVQGIMVSKLPIVLPGRPHGLRVLVDRSFENEGIRLPVRYEVDNLATILRFVEEGMAYTILPYAAVSGLQRNDRVAIWWLENPSIKRRMVLATSTQRPVTTTTRELVRILKDQVNELVASGVWVPKGSHAVIDRLKDRASTG